MNTQDLITLVGKDGPAWVILLALVWKGLPFLNKFLDQMKARNGDLRALVLVLKDLVVILKERG